MDGGNDEGRAPSKPEMVVLSERSGGGIQPEVVVDPSIRKTAKGVSRVKTCVSTGFCFTFVVGFYWL